MREALHYRYTPTVAVRKKLQKVGNSQALVLDRDLVAALLPDGDLEQTLLVEVVGDTLVVRRETSDPLPDATLREATERMRLTPEAFLELSGTKQLILKALLAGPGTTNEVTARVPRSRPTVSLALNRFQRDGLVEKTGRDWRLSEAGRELLEASLERGTV